MKRIFLLLMTLIAGAGTPSAAAELTVMSGGAPKEALNILVPRFEKLTGHHVKLSYVLVSSVRQKILRGESADVVILPSAAIEDLIAANKIAAEGHESFGTVKLVAIVRKGTAQPDVATVDTFKTTLLNARSVVYSTPGSTPSGTHIADIVSRLGIAEAVERKATYRPALEGGVALVTEGKADIGIYPASEVVGVDGVASAGAIPEELQLTLVYTAAVTTANKTSEPALALIRYLTSAENRETWQRAGFDPPQ
jgi:molybdate transport system substrate-binding protein